MKKVIISALAAAGLILTGCERGEEEALGGGGLVDQTQKRMGEYLHEGDAPPPEEPAVEPTDQGWQPRE